MYFILLEIMNFFVFDDNYIKRILNYFKFNDLFKYCSMVFKLII